MAGKKIAVMIREETGRSCIGKGCFAAFNQRKDSFARYPEGEAELVAFCTDGGRSEDPFENLKNRIEKFKKAGVEVVHLSTCNRSKNPFYEEMKRILSAHFEVVGYTHGPEKRKEKDGPGSR